MDLLADFIFSPKDVQQVCVYTYIIYVCIGLGLRDLLTARAMTPQMTPVLMAIVRCS